MFVAKGGSMTIPASAAAMTADDETRHLGAVMLTPAAPVVAGSRGTWTLTYTAGALGLDDGAALLVAVRQIADWGPPQTSDPAGANYVRATTSADATLQVAYSPRAFLRPWRQGLVVTVTDGHLAPGDTITLVLGDRTGGGPGLLMQTFPERHFAFRVLVDCFGSGAYRPLATQPTLTIVAGPAVRLVAVGPATAPTGAPTGLLVRALDRWGNPAPSYRGTVTVAGPPGATLPAPYTFQAAEGGGHRFAGLVFATPATYRLTVADASAGFTATANPCLCHDAAAPAPLALYWGDPHGQSEETVGTGDVAAYWAYLRDVAGVDFGAHCGNDFQITTAFYARLRALVQHYHAPGRFIPFLAYEWSGNHAAGGDHNVYFLHDDPARSPLHRSSHWQVADQSDLATDRYPIAALRDEFRGRDDVLLLPHVGGRRANLATVDDVGQSPLIEIASVHGRFPWFARDALELGLRVGFIAGSDDHTGRPGAAPPTNRDLVCWGGLTGVYAPALTRAALWAALRQRHCYGTTGARIIVAVDADGHQLGDVYTTASAPRFTVRVAGTAPIERIELRRGWDVLAAYDALSAPPPGWAEPTTRARLRVTWSGAETKNRRKVTTWDGGLTLSGGRILAATPYHLAHPREHLTLADAQRVTWCSQTSGDEDGVTLDLALSRAAVLHLATPVLGQAFPLRAIGAAPLVVPVGGADRQVTLRWVQAAPGPLDVTWLATDPAPLAGEQAYWVWLAQADGEWAWSSPLFVTVRAGRS
jgi:hypothetical protein